MSRRQTPSCNGQVERNRFSGGVRRSMAFPVRATFRRAVDWASSLYHARYAPACHKSSQVALAPRSLYFCSGSRGRKHRNAAQSPTGPVHFFDHRRPQVGSVVTLNRCRRLFAFYRSTTTVPRGRAWQERIKPSRASSGLKASAQSCSTAPSSSITLQVPH